MPHTWTFVRNDTTFVVTPLDRLHSTPDQEETMPTDYETLVNQNLTSTARMGLRRRDIDRSFEVDDLEIRLSEPGASDYISLLSQGYSFLRRHHDGHYSDRTMIEVQRAIDSQYDDQPSGPRVVIARTKASVDLVSEVKKGGPLAAGFTFGERMVLAVHQAHRIEGLGGQMVKALRSGKPKLSTWVGTGNVGAQVFLLKSGWIITGMNNQGSIRFENGMGAGNGD